MHGPVRSLVLASLLLGFTGAPVHADLLDPVRERVADRTAALDELAATGKTGAAVERAELLLTTGQPDEAYGLMDSLLAAGVRGRILAVRACLAVQDFARVPELLEALQASDPDNDEVRALAYRWWTLIDDLGRVEAAEVGRLASGTATPADRLAAASLAGRLLRFDEARAKYEEALPFCAGGEDSARAWHGLGTVLYRQRDFDGSLDALTRALGLSEPDPDLLMTLANTLIRLGRTADAIAATKLAVRIAPYHEAAHYMLGNGYADKNYTELEAAYPKAFADRDGRAALAAADALLAQGSADGARAAYTALAGAHPGWADVPVRLGSLDFAERGYEAARREFMKALAACPEYGRAHNGMAKALEGQRLAVEIHHAAQEARFDAEPMPDVPGIETFVVNWNALSPRHKKRVALSIAPWKRFIPVLVEGGATYYIKPLYELLSETPGQELLRDQRISYDSRLWDDVRGCGGYHTVTGIEDVERTVFDRYNTVLHELTHQVHGVLPSGRGREIQDLYHRAKERDEAGNDAFLSRYAGGSVWEYFAEGANALESPRRDAYDTREIVKERLDEKDPALEHLVLVMMNEVDVDSCYAVAYVNRGDDRLEMGKPEEAVAAYRQAIERAPDEETAQASLAFALEVDGEAGKALELASRESARQPESATLALRHADALWTAGRGLHAAIETLRASRNRVRENERYRVDLELGRLYWVAGNADSAGAAYARALDYQADNPEGLWGRAASLALAGDWDGAWTVYEEAVRHRTGVVALRADFARDLLRAGETERAGKQLDEARLLDAEDPDVLALTGWLRIEEGDAEGARTAAARALELAPWSDLARIVLARIARTGGNPAEAASVLQPLRDRIRDDAPPEYVYRPRWGRYEQVHTLPAVERGLIADAD